MKDEFKQEISMMCRRNKASKIIDCIEGFYNRRGCGATSYNSLDCQISKVLENAYKQIDQLEKDYDSYIQNEMKKHPISFKSLTS